MRKEITRLEYENLRKLKKDIDKHRKGIDALYGQVLRTLEVTDLFSEDSEEYNICDTFLNDYGFTVRDMLRDLNVTIVEDKK